jgi:hypothetical protein
MHQSPAGAKAANLAPAIRAGSTGQPNLCQHSLDIRPKNGLAVCNPRNQAQRVFLSIAKDDKGRSAVKRAIQEEKWMYSNCQNAKLRMESWHEGQQKGLTLKALPCFPLLSVLGILKSSLVLLSVAKDPGR